MGAKTARTIRDDVIPAKEYLGLELMKGQILRIEDIEGNQVADLVCYNAKDLREKMKTGSSISASRRYILTTGHVLRSDDFNPMLTIVADTVGQNTATPSFCSEELLFFRHGQHGLRNCRDNLALAVAPWGITKYQLPPAFAIFMNYVFHEDGHVEIGDGRSRAGDHVELRAEMDLVVGISVCPMDQSPINGLKVTPMRVTVFEPAGDPTVG
jgi:uncharacterized protein YcgI (DUF1989 family)